MTSESPYAAALEATIASELAANDAQLEAVLSAATEQAEEKSEYEHEQVEHGKVSGVREQPRRHRIYSDEENDTIARLQAHARRLRQVQKLFKDDPELMRIVDETIGNQVKTAEQRQQAQARVAQRRQTVFSFIFSALSLVAGWLLSAVSPVSAVAHLVGH